MGVTAITKGVTTSRMQNKEILDAELWAILNALEIAIKEMANTKSIPISIFCDSQEALEAIQHPCSRKENWVLRVTIYRTAGTLQENEHPIVLRCVPSYSGIIGDEKANLAAKISHNPNGCI